MTIGPPRSSFSYVNWELSWWDNHLSSDLAGWSNPSYKLVQISFKGLLSADLSYCFFPPGTELWVQKLTWPGLVHFNSTTWTPEYVKSKQGDTAYFYKSYENFAFFWIMKAGHMVSSTELHIRQYCYTVKPALVNTCLQGPHILFTLKMVSHWTCTKWPVYKDHFLWFPWAVALDRFDCSCV